MTKLVLIPVILVPILHREVTLWITWDWLIEHPKLLDQLNDNIYLNQLHMLKRVERNRKNENNWLQLMKLQIVLWLVGNINSNVKH